MKNLLTVLSLILCLFRTSAQDTLVERAVVNAAEQQAVDLYHRFMGNQSRLYNGVDRTFYHPLIKGFAFFLTDSLQTGSIVYDGMLYKNVPMQYDIYAGEIMIRHYRGYRIKLLTERVSEFDLAGHHFVRHVYNSSAASSLRTGFYDHVYSGKTAFLVKRAKLLDEKLTDKVEQEFLPNDLYYIFRNGHYYTCRSFRGLLGILQGRSRQVRRYLRHNRIRYRADPELAILKATQYYDTLNN